jgi:hypothetical protein
MNHTASRLDLPIIPSVARPDASHSEKTAVLQQNIQALEQFLHAMNLRHAHLLADSAHRTAKYLADSNLHASSVSFERFLRTSPASPRRLLELAVRASASPPVRTEHDSMASRLQQLAKDEQDMHEQYLVAQETMSAAFHASLAVHDSTPSLQMLQPANLSCYAPHNLIPDQ